MSQRLLVVLTSICLWAGGAQSAVAATIFVASLDGLQEVPPNASPGSGDAIFTLSTDFSTLTVDDVAFQDLLSPTVAAHIHCCSVPGVNSGVKLNFATFFPFGVTAGSAGPHVFTLATDLIGITPAAFVQGLFDGEAYVNIHTNLFPGGEIRGQLEVQPVPEPATMSLVGIGAAALIAARRKRRAASSSKQSARL